MRSGNSYPNTMTYLLSAPPTVSLVSVAVIARPACKPRLQAPKQPSQTIDHSLSEVRDFALDSLFSVG